MKNSIQTESVQAKINHHKQSTFKMKRKSRTADWIVANTRHLNERKSELASDYAVLILSEKRLQIKLLLACATLVEKQTTGMDVIILRLLFIEEEENRTWMVVTNDFTNQKTDSRNLLLT
jgi:hypothetical protein